MLFHVITSHRVAVHISQKLQFSAAEPAAVGDISTLVPIPIVNLPIDTSATHPLLPSCLDLFLCRSFSTVTSTLPAVSLGHFSTVSIRYIHPEQWPRQVLMYGSRYFLSFAHLLFQSLSFSLLGRVDAIVHRYAGTFTRIDGVTILHHTLTYTDLAPSSPGFALVRPRSRTGIRHLPPAVDKGV